MPAEGLAPRLLGFRHLEPETGIEPARACLQDKCSANMSYSGKTPKMKRPSDILENLFLFGLFPLAAPRYIDTLAVGAGVAVGVAAINFTESEYHACQLPQIEIIWLWFFAENRVQNLCLGSAMPLGQFLKPLVAHAGQTEM